MADAWTKDQDVLLQQMLLKHPATLEKNERWRLISEGVPGRSKKECAQRFNAIREVVVRQQGSSDGRDGNDGGDKIQSVSEEVPASATDKRGDVEINEPVQDTTIRGDDISKTRNSGEPRIPNQRQELPKSNDGKDNSDANPTKRSRNRTRRVEDGGDECGHDVDPDAAEFISKAIATVSMDDSSTTNATANNGIGVKHKTIAINRNDNVAAQGGDKVVVQKQRGKKKSAVTSNVTSTQQQQQQPKQQQSTNADKKKNKKKKGNDRYPWRKSIPVGLDDPISLEPLNKLPYPPFAVVVEPPYIPIRPGMWPPLPPDTRPITSTVTSNTTITDNKDKKEREMAVLREQWGDKKVSAILPKIKENERSNDIIINSENSNIYGRQVNLFDGRVLAYYLVSTLQFIDPFNRRDLTRGELQALDAYLAYHRLGKARVVEAYDCKGVTLSTAGRAAQSATGRAEILQQEAAAILGSFFTRGGGGGGGDQSNNERPEPVTNSFQRIYAAQQGGSSRNNIQQGPPALHDVGIYEGEGGGLLVIDDDLNPGLRSGIVETGGSYSAHTNIAETHSHVAQIRDAAFPSLSQVVMSVDAGDAATRKGPPQPSGTSKSLSKIAKIVKKTDLKQTERMIKAREDAERRANRMTFFSPNSGTPAPSLSSNITLPTNPLPPSEAVLERNRNMAMALGVAPSTVRSAPTPGWARPVSQTQSAVSVVDLGAEFEKELDMNAVANYPDALLLEAKDRMVELLKLESKWKKFLVDDKAASCSLKPMNRPMRQFVHEYSDFWKLHTESFDPEGKRYIYCAKLDDTCAPNPLLSEAARKWRGHTTTAPSGPNSVSVDLSLLPTGPAPKSSSSAAIDGWRDEQRVPLKLAPRTLDGAKYVPDSSMGGLTRTSSTQLLSMTSKRPQPTRFTALHEKERPKMQLVPRSIPTWDELEKRNISQSEWNDMTLDQQEVILLEMEEEERRKALQRQRDQEKEEVRVHRKMNKSKKKQGTEEKKQAILMSAFDSSDEEDNSSDSEWSEGVVAFNGSDDE